MLRRTRVNNTGIFRGRILGLFGTKFALAWSDLRTWSPGETVLRARDGTERVIMRFVEVTYEGGLELIEYHQKDQQRVLGYFEQHAPGKRTTSKMEELSKEQAQLRSQQ